MSPANKEDDLITVDAHIDIPWIMYKNGPFDLAAVNKERSQTDFTRMVTGGLDIAFFALYLSDEVQDKLGPAESIRKIWAQRDWLEKQDWGILAETKAEALEAHGTGFTPFFIGIEGGRLIDSSLLTLRKFRSEGIRYLTLTHNKNTSWADSATDAPQLNGLSRFGTAIVRCCNMIGIVVDVSHSSDATAEAAIKESKKPVIASHSGCRKLIDHPRNLSNELIKMIAQTGGVIHVPFAKRFVGNNYKNVGDHIDYMLQLVGPDHVGIGSDLDGAVMAKGIGDVCDWKKVVIDEMNKRNYADHVIRKIAGGNTLRMFEDKV